jgi:hypothetical protein
MKKLFLTKKQRSFYGILIIAKHLNKSLKWVPGEKNGLEKLVKFFQKTSALEEAYNNLPSNTFFFLKKNRNFLNDLKSFIYNVGSYEDECEKSHCWNRTKKGEIPSSESIFVYIDELQRIALYENGIEILTKSVAKHLKRRQEPIPEEKQCKEKYSEQIKQGGAIIDEICCTFMRDNYKLLKNAICNYYLNK